MNFSIRIPVTEKRIEILKKKAISKKKLTKICDTVFKRRGISLSVYRPDEVTVRLRKFIEDDRLSTLVKISTEKIDTGHTDKKEKLGEGKTEQLLKKAEELGYEGWGKIVTVSTKYNLGYAQVLLQELSSIGTFLKIESDTQEGLNKTLKLLEVKEDEKIEKNAAVLLGEKLGLI